MSNTITVNIDNLTPEERKTLLKLVEKGNTDKKWWKGTKFDVEDAWNYYFVNSNGEVCNAFNVEKNKKKQFGNACTDYAYIACRKRTIKLYNLLSNFAEVVNEGWIPNWENGIQKKWNIRYDYNEKRYVPTYAIDFEGVSEVYFKTEELAKRAINEIILPFQRGEL